MDFSPVARKIMKLALPSVRAKTPFFDMMWREVMLGRDRGWLDDDRAQLLAQMISEHGASEAQLFQDIWALFETKNKRGGFFVEFGATNGVKLSNTHLLEAAYGWRGILAEPNPAWHEELRRNRPSAAISTRCVWSKSDETLAFLATSDAELGTLASFAAQDRHAKIRVDNEEISVATISLDDLLDKYKAPREIDYISVDTEGSELRILEAFDFIRWDVSLFSVEHNHTDQERAIENLMSAKGYERRFAGFSRFDAWFRKRR